MTSARFTDFTQQDRFGNHVGVVRVNHDELINADEWAWVDSGHATVADYVAHHWNEDERVFWWILGSDNQQIGLLSLFRHRRLSNWAVSVYVHESHRGHHVCATVVASLGVAAREVGHAVLATVTASNTASVRAFSRVVAPISPRLYGSSTGDEILIFDISGTPHTHENVSSELVHEFTRGLIALPRKG